MTDSDQPQRFCRNCGAQVRSGNAFCVSCGVNLSSDLQSSNHPTHEEASVASQQRLQGLYEKARVSWSRLDTRVKWGVLGIVGIVLLILLSPIAKWVSIVALSISVLILIVQAVRREPLKQWGILSAALLISVWMFSGMSSAIYGGGPPVSSNTNGGNQSEDIGAAESSGQSDSGSPLQTEDIDLDDPSSVNTDNFIAQSILEGPILDDGRELRILGNAEYLYEEDIIAIADSIDYITTEYDLVTVNILWNPAAFGSSAGDFDTYALSGMCNRATVTISNSYAGQVFSDVEQGYYEYGCVE